MYYDHARRASRPHRENVVGGGTNEYGEPVLLLLPSDDCREGRNRKKNNSVASVASSSHAGGLPRYHDGDKLCSPLNLTCTTCNHGPMYLLLQLHAPLDDVDRTLYVFGCNNASCHSSSSINCLGEDDDTNTSTFRSCMGNGSLRCFRSQQRWPTIDNLVSSPTSISKVEKKNDVVEDTDYWGADVNGGWGATKTVIMMTGVAETIRPIYRWMTWSP